MSEGQPAGAAISLRQTTPTMKWVGQVCPKCGNQIAVGQDVVLCPKCYTPHHAQCWRDNGNQCATDGTPARIIEPRGRAAGAAAAAPTSPTPTPPTPSADTAAAAAPPAARPAAGAAPPPPRPVPGRPAAAPAAAGAARPAGRAPAGP